MKRYPNYLSIVSIRDDGDFELLATLNGDTIEDDSAWNAVVNTTFQNLKMAKDNVFALNRSDAPDMLDLDDDALKADALPGCATPRHAPALRFPQEKAQERMMFAALIEPDMCAFWQQSPEIIPKSNAHVQHWLPQQEQSNDTGNTARSLEASF